MLDLLLGWGGTCEEGQKQRFSWVFLLSLGGCPPHTESGAFARGRGSLGERRHQQSQEAGRAAAQVPVSSCGHEQARGEAAGSVDLGSSVC